MLWVPDSGFGWKLSSESGVRLAAAYGTTITPAQNAKGSWVEVFTAAEVEADVYGIWACLNSGATGNEARDLLTDIGFDPAGGTSYQVAIPDLLAMGISGLGSSSSTGIGAHWYFPRFIPAGSSIAVRSSVNSATLGSLRAWLRLFGRPHRPEMHRAGQYVTAFGVTAASSSGTAITPGTTSEGTPWTSLGTTDKDYFYWQLGVGMNDPTMNNTLLMAVDLAYGDASNKTLIVEDELVIFNGTEAAYRVMGPPAMYHHFVPAGVELWARAQNGGTNDSGYSVIAYGVGG
jgi:hypothetical protein